MTSPTRHKIHYSLTVQTGREGKAGTDARVYAALCGAGGDTEEHELQGDFETGSLDKPEFDDSRNVGDIRYLRIRHDNTGTNPGWFLNYVTVAFEGKEWDFRAYRWLAESEADKQTEVVLAPFKACPRK